VRPVQQLTNTANAIAAGRLDVQLNVTDGGEIGVMASALDNMRRQLLANIEKLSQWNEVLEARVTAQTRELQEQQELTKQLLHRTISAQEAERGRIARELHDEFGQTLTAIELNLTHLEQKSAQHNGLLSNNIQQCRQLTHQSITELRRIVIALRPGVLDQLGLVASLHWISQQFLAPQGIQVAIQVEPFPSDLSKNIETILFRIAQEAVNNIVRHSQAKNVSIRLSTQADQLHLIIQDDGTGYESRPLNGGVVSQQLGLAGMQERASLVGGVVEITSQPQMGTLVHVTVPVSPDSQVNLSLHKDETLS
jgi:signal transduction histidine kinase